MKRLVAACALMTVLGASKQAWAQFELKWDMEGYYRSRAVLQTNLAPEPRYEITHPAFNEAVLMPDIRRTSYLTHRLRLSPKLQYGNIATLYMQLDGLNDVLWGDNNGINTAPLFAVEGSNQGFLGGPQRSSIEMTRAWVEFMVPVGLVRVGRQPSHWGLGILSNGGGSFNLDPTTPTGKPARKHADTYFDEDFGDNHFGSTNDRILFATRPLTIMRTIQKKANTESNFVVAYAFDKISEAPHLFAEEDRRIRPEGQQGFISRGAEQDDVNEHVFVAAYADSDWDQVRYTDELKFGTYWVLRTQAESFTEPTAGAPNTPGDCASLPDPASCVTEDEGSLVWIADFWYRIRYGAWYSEAEYIHIGGETTGGVPFPAANRRKKANINGLVGRFGHLTPAMDAVLELGWASGDDNLSDVDFKQRPLHPDFNVGLILFEEVLRERSARVFGPPFFSQANVWGATGFMSKGGVVNAKYLAPKIRYRPGFGGVEVVGQVLMAWLDSWSEPPNLFVCPPGKLDASGSCTASKYLGTEFDLALKSRFAGGHMDFSLETGYLLFGDALKTRSDGSGRKIPAAPAGAFSLQARIAYLF